MFMLTAKIPQLNCCAYLGKLGIYGAMGATTSTVTFIDTGQHHREDGNSDGSTKIYLKLF